MGKTYRKRKKLACPVCSFQRLIDADEHTATSLVPESRLTNEDIPDYYQKCPQCKNQIAIIKLE